MLSLVSGLTLATLLLASSADALQGGRRQRGAPASQQPKQAPKKEEKKPENEKKKKPTPIAYTNATVHVGRDGIVLRRATVLIEGSKIKAVGPDVELPKGTKKVDCTGKHISPGFVIPGTSGMGVGFSVSGKYADSLNPFDESIKRGLAVGITSFLTSSGSGSSAKSAIVKPIPGELDGAVLKEPAVHSMSVPLGPDGLRKFKESVEKIRKYQKEKAEYEKKKAQGSTSAPAPQRPETGGRGGGSGGRRGGRRGGGAGGQGSRGSSASKEPKLDKKLEPLLEVIEGKRKLMISPGAAGGVVIRRGRIFFGGRGGPMNVKQIREALRIAKLLKVGVFLVGATEAWIIPDEIAATGSACLIRPRSRTSRDETREGKGGSNLATCKILDEAGIPVCVSPPSGGFGGGPTLGTGGLLGRDLNTPFMDACIAIRGGMDPERALSTITFNAAKALGIDDRVGSLETDKDADLLILDGDPLHYKTFVVTAIVNGKVRYEKDKEPLYGHIRRNGR